MASNDLYSDQMLSLSDSSLPLINISDIENWAANKDLVRGVSNRWFVPMKTQGTDTLLLVMNITKERDLGIG